MKRSTRMMAAALVAAGVSAAGMTAPAEAAGAGGGGIGHPQAGRGGQLGIQPGVQPRRPHASRPHGVGPQRRHGIFGGYGAPVPHQQVVVLREAEEAPPVVDHRSFATMRVGTGIAYPPKAAPVLYRLEGPRHRPVARIIDLGGGAPERSARHGRAQVAHNEGPRIVPVRPR